MLREEAIWLASKIYSLDSNHVFPMLNIGCASKKFREKEQPWIDDKLFKPARNTGHSVIHTDIKNEIGVDLVGDLSNPDFLEKISQMEIKSVMCSSLLEHVSNREEICEIISSIIPIGGYLFVTVPYKFPYHCDPIDTMFRPSVNELSRLFPDMKIHHGEIVAGDYLVKATSVTPILYALLMLIRIMLPIYQPRRWFDSVRYASWLWRENSVTCIVLEKK